MTPLEQKQECGAHGKLENATPSVATAKERRPGYVSTTPAPESRTSTAHQNATDQPGITRTAMQDAANVCLLYTFFDTYISDISDLSNQ